MIAFLIGEISYKSIDTVLLSVGNIGYRLSMAERSVSALGDVGDEVKVYTHLHVRESDVSLFGFLDEAEYEMFLLLNTVSGVGPKVALAVLSTFATPELAHAIGLGDVSTITKAPGIGKKTAHRIVVDLKDKFTGLETDFAPTAESIPDSVDTTAMAEAKAALQSMGFRLAEVDEAFKKINADESTSTQELIVLGLQLLSKA